MAEELTQYYRDAGVRVRYIHADVDTLERVELLEALRKGEFDVLVGINLLREGLDLPEVSLVAILDADREGYLRSETSLIQTMGRAARNMAGQVVLYADEMTRALENAIEETNRRREVQEAYNEEHGITPASAQSSRSQGFPMPFGREGGLLEEEAEIVAEQADKGVQVDEEELAELIGSLERKMAQHAERLEFEQAAKLRDKIRALKELAAPEA
ncbi:MAG: helicase-related protein, partial [Candidatus Thermoplasmatota archaeon]|nr:helicase-related protein [Candidatus Thermoplasmatota archaeon]